MAEKRAFTALPLCSSTPLLWGDGFAGDDFASSRSMTAWDLCSPDEYAFAFTQLLPEDGRLPSPLLAHLELCVAVRAWRLSRPDGATPPGELRSRLPAASEAQRQQTLFFVADGAVTRFASQFGLFRTSHKRIATEGRLLALLDHLLHLIQSNLVPSWAEDREALFAFGSGIHPAYLWPESAVTPSRGYTAAWLGHLDRGRSALMPESVADYLLDAVLDGSRSYDRTLAALVGSDENVLRLRRAATRRLQGEDPSVRFSLGRYRKVATMGELRPATAFREELFEHA